jgi:hypothetical protein
MCDECGTAFQVPLLATVKSHGSSQKYYACPRCLTKVAEIRTQQKEERTETASRRTEVRKIGSLNENEAKCQHFLGYLKKRPKDTSIPDECLTCDRMVECLYIQ